MISYGQLLRVIQGAPFSPKIVKKLFLPYINLSLKAEQRVNSSGRGVDLSIISYAIPPSDEESNVKILIGIPGVKRNKRNHLAIYFICFIDQTFKKINIGPVNAVSPHILA